jgi:uncharacterized membrane protein YfbV (UPF0208 family)
VRGALPVLLLLALPEAAHACAVCGAAVDRNKSAFVGTTILLSLLPLALIGAGLWWIGRHAGERLAGELADREIDVGAPGRPAGGGEG